MRTIRRHRARSAVALPLLALLLAGSGCASVDPQPASLEDVRSAAPSSGADEDAAAGSDDEKDEAGERSASKQAEPKQEAAPLRVGSLTKETILPAMMAAMHEYSTARVRIDLTAGQRVLVEGQARYGGELAEMQMTMTAPGLGEGPVEMRVVDGVLYASMQPFTPKGSFISLDPDDPSNPAGQSASAVTGMLDQTRSVQALEEGLEKVTYLGREGGLHHYRLVVDARLVSMAQTGTYQPEMPEKFSYEMWLDDRALPLRSVYDQGNQMRMEMTTSAWGEPVRIVAPPKDKIVELPKG